MPSPLRRHVQRGLRAPWLVFSFTQSIIAEYLVYVLVFYSVTSIVSFNLLPLSLVEHLLLGHHAIVDVPSKFFLFPGTDVLALGSGTWTLHQTALLVTARAITARLALALAGWIVRKRLPAHSFCAGAGTGGGSPPIRWWFEYFCYFANRHPFVTLNLERCVLKILQLRGLFSEGDYLYFITRPRAPLTRLGTILPEELEQLRVFKHKYLAAVSRYEERSSEGHSVPKTPMLPIQYGELARWYCAREVSRCAQEEADVEQGRPDPLASREIEGAGPGADENAEAEGNTTSSLVSRDDCPYLDFLSLCFMYLSFLFYPLYRVAAEFSGTVAPFIGYPSSSEEYYDLHCAQPPNLPLQTN